MKDLLNISIVVPTFNSEKHIQQSLKTIFKNKFLSNTNFEVIVVNDGSHDETENILNALKKDHHLLRVFHLRTNVGQLYATNIGIELAKAKFIVTIDDDLQFNPVNIEKLYNEINSSSFWIINAKSNVLSSSKKYLFFRKIGVELVFAIFFKQYIKKGGFSSFRIIDKEALKRENIINIYHFWEIPLSKISYCEIVKTKGIREKTSYSLLSRVKVFRYILLKCFIEVLKISTVILFLIFFFTINFSFFIISLFSVVLILFLSFKLKHDKFQYLSIAREEKVLLK